MRRKKIRAAGSPSLAPGILLLAPTIFFGEDLELLYMIPELVAGVLLIIGYMRTIDSLEETAKQPVPDQSA